MNNLDEQQIAEAENQYWVDLAESLEALHKNPDFQKLILKGYFTDKAVNSVSMLSQRSVVSGGHRPAVMEALVGISSLQDFFITVRNLGTVSLDDEETEE
jgi:hypothetical protein